MAFYTSRIDDNGNELERRYSARSVSTTLSDNSLRLDISSQGCSNKNSVRYVNRAAFIEKGSGQSEVSSISDEHKEQITTPECQSDIVPPLDLESEENYPTTRDYTFSYRKHCEAAKIVLKPDKAYETWLSAKRKLLSDEAARRKKAQEQKREEQEARKRLSEEKLKSWFENKARQQNQWREKLRIAEVMEDKPTKAQISEEEAQMKIIEWERQKRLVDERRRTLKRQEEDQRRKTEELRRQQAAKAWEEWLAEAANKPKPVPLNRGIFTLRGTISDIYINPNEWKDPLDETKEEKGEK